MRCSHDMLRTYVSYHLDVEGEVSRHNYRNRHSDPLVCYRGPTLLVSEDSRSHRDDGRRYLENCRHCSRCHRHEGGELIGQLRDCCHERFGSPSGLSELE